jgi:hypothetical protein
MEKISGILKTSQRVTSVDMKDAPPIRPGTPAFGRPEGTSALKDRKTAADAAEAAQAAHQTMMHWRTREGQNAKAVNDIADRFFSANRQDVLPISKQAPEVPVIGEADIERSPASFEEEVEMVNPLHDEPIEGEYYPKGSFLNAVA